MVWVTFTCSGTIFSKTLADNAVANGWVRAVDTPTPDWIQPAALQSGGAWNPANNVCFGRITYLAAPRAYTEISVTTYQYTIFEPIVRGTYDTATHTGIGAGWVGQGNPIYWVGRTEDDTTKNFTFNGWIDGNSIIGNVTPDATITGATAFPIFFCVVKGFDGVNRLVGLDMMPSGAAYRCNARLIYATDSLAYWKGLNTGGLGVWAFDNLARLSRMYVIRGGVNVTDVINPAAIEDSFEDPVTGIPYVLCSKHQGVEVYQDQCILIINTVSYYYKCMYGVLTPPQTVMLTEKNSNFNAITVPAKGGVDRILIYWVRCQ